MKLYILSLVFVLCAACGATVMNVTDLNPTTGLIDLKSEKNAEVIIDVPIDLDLMRSFVVAPEGFFGEQLDKLGYFEAIWHRDDLETAVIQNNLTHIIPELEEEISFALIAQHYKPFLYLVSSIEEERTENRYYALTLMNPLKDEPVFRVKRHMGLSSQGFSDENMIYPAYNELYEYIRRNSKAF